MRPTKDEWFRDMALLVSRRSACHRLAVGCVLVDARGHVLSTGYNGRAAGLPNCNERAVSFKRSPTGISIDPEFHRDVETFPHRCPNSDAPSGQPNGCEAVHAEQNALLQCRDVYAIDSCHCTHSPCLVCVKLLLNTSCRRVLFSHEYPHADARRLWAEAGREWVRLSA